MIDTLLVNVPNTLPTRLCILIFLKDACLKAHNEKRALHGSSPLVWDPTLAQHAQDWANHLASIEDLQHAQNTGEGENLYGSVGPAPTTCVSAVESW